jgi:polyhydroxyalkanoate synthesis regulator phasin
MNKKLIAAIATTALALTVSSGAVASADSGRGKDKLSSLLSGLVSKGTITQSQADAIVKAQTDAKALAQASRPTQAEMQANRTAEIAVITSTLGITEATLTSRMKAGESLAIIAGAKKDALITALVAFENNAIDARVTAGKLTAAQATQMKANTTAHVTEEVNEVRGFGKKGLSHGGKGPKGGPAAGGLVNPGVGTTSTAKYSSGMTMRA